MTELLMVFVTAIAGLLLVDPFYGGALVQSPFTKVIILSLGLGAIVFHLIGRAVIAPRRLGSVFKLVLAQWWPLLVLSLIIIGGAGYARYAQALTQNFLGMGLGMIYLPLLATAVASSDKPMLLLKGLLAVYILMAGSMLGILISTDHLFHESIFMTVPLGAYFLTARKVGVWQFLLGLGLIGVCAFSVKNTTFIMIMVTLSACAAVMLTRLLRTRTGLAVTASVYAGTLVFALLVLAMYLVWSNYKSLLPSGNVEYRVEMYSIAWRRFLDSPVWGTGFTDSSVNYFSLYRTGLATQYLPTHSDVLDMAAQGGLIAMVLWVASVRRILLTAWAAVRQLTAPASDLDLRPWRWLFVLALVQINAIITYAVNPPLINPLYGFWIWGGAGVMWALHWQLTQGVKPKPVGVSIQNKASWA
jgi:O-antigen ligase